MTKTGLLLLLAVSLSLCASAQNVGIGTTSPAYKLDVAGTLRATGTITGGGNVNATGTITGNNVTATGNVTAHGGGVLYNTVTPAATNLKVYYRTAAFQVTGLAAHSVSIEGTVGIGGGFTQPPMVFVGDIVTTGGTAGPLFELQLVAYQSTTGSFKIRILNNSNFTISQNCTWNIMCIGQ